MYKKRCNPNRAKNKIHKNRTRIKPSIKLQNMLHNKSQISVFFVLGFLLILITIVFVITTQLHIGDKSAYYKKNIQSKFDKESLVNYIEEYCLVKNSQEILQELGLNGGTLNRTTLLQSSVNYHGQHFRLLCINVEGSRRCINRVLTLKEMEEAVAAEIQKQLDTCIDFDYFKKKGYKIVTGPQELKVKIGVDKVNFELFYPIEMARDSTVVSAKEFRSEIKHPIGVTYKLMLDILNHETTEGYFNKDKWMNEFNMQTKIEKHKPYPYIIYSLEARNQNKKQNNQIDNTNFIFNFGIEHEDRASKVGRNYLYDLEYGCCYVENNCFKNVDEYTCKLKTGSYEPYPECKCNYHFQQNLAFAQDPGFKDCSSSAYKSHGESWCINELGIGGRSVKKSCYDGEIITEECKDFKEEICVEYQQAGKKNAICKPNRWEDCTKCLTESCCENDLMRDCTWKQQDYTVEYESETRQCIPKVSPGFRHYDGAGQEVCNLGTKYAICQGYNCPEEWVNYASEFCSYLGDCGINKNHYNKITKSGYFETDPKYKPDISYLASNQLPFISLNLDQDFLVYTEEKETIALIPALISAGLRYMDDLANRRNTIIDYSFCGLWQPPLDNQECTRCSEKAEKETSDGIPCSEYRCMSLGQDCLYREENGFPVCERRSQQQTPPIIGFTSNISYEEKILLVPGNQGIEIRGYEISDKLAPYELLNFQLSTSSPTKCKITYFPDLSFTESPAIWFGKPSFSAKHNVSLRLPEKIHIPEKLYKNLNITSINELFYMILDNEDKLVDFFEEGFLNIAELIRNALFQREFIIGLLDLTISGLEQNTYYTFIRCSDQSGNENPEPVYLKFTIDNNYNDAKEPQIVYTIPRNNSELNLEEYELSVYVNEPAECRFSEQDDSYLAMPYEFDCETSAMKMSGISHGSYECKAATDILNPHIKCMDNPPIIDKFLFNAEYNQNTTPVNYIINGRDVYLREINLYNNTIVYLEDPNTMYNIHLLLNNNKTCRSSLGNLTGFDYNNMEDMECSFINSSETSPEANQSEDNESAEFKVYSSSFYDYECTKELAPGDYPVYVFCIGRVPLNRNTNQNSYVLEFSFNNELDIISVFPGYGGTVYTDIVELAVVVNRNINDHGVNCGYSLDNEHEFYQMYQQGSYQFKRRINNLQPGLHNILYKCVDSSTNTAEKQTSFTIS